MRKWFVLLTLLLTIGILAACSGKDEAKTDTSSKEIKIGATSGPFTDMVTKAIKPGLEKKGYKVEVVEFSDYIQPNIALSKDDIQANVFQNKVYMETFAEQNNLQLSEVITVPTAPMGIYSKKFKDLNAIKDGAALALPNDPTNATRALLILENEGLIKLDPKANPLKVSEKDVQENVKNIQFKPIEAGQLPRAVESADLSAVPGNFAIAANMDINSAIALEDIKDIYRNRVVVDTKNADSQFVKDIKEVVESKEFEVVIDKEFAGFTKPDWMTSHK